VSGRTEVAVARLCSAAHAQPAAVSPRAQPSRHRSASAATTAQATPVGAEPRVQQGATLESNLSTALLRRSRFHQGRLCSTCRQARPHTRRRLGQQDSPPTGNATATDSSARRRPPRAHFAHGNGRAFCPASTRTSSSQPQPRSFACDLPATPSCARPLARCPRPPRHAAQRACARRQQPPPLRPIQIRVRARDRPEAVIGRVKGYLSYAPSFLWCLSDGHQTSSVSPSPTRGGRSRVTSSTRVNEQATHARAASGQLMKPAGRCCCIISRILLCIDVLESTCVSS